jgi:fucose 4-O-acetylase-like acetyltransferase
MLAQRKDSVDVAKGVAIVLVVYGHALRGLLSADLISNDSIIIITDYIIYTFHMPLFFLISGFFFKSSSKDGNKTKFWRKRVKTIVYPYLLWSLIQGGIQILLSNSSATNGSMDIGTLASIIWNPISPFWFLYALFFCQVFWFVVSNRIRPDVVVALSLCAFVALYFWAEPQTLQDVAYGLFYFSAGVWGAQHDLLRRLPTRWSAASVLVVAGLALAAGCYALGVPERLPVIAALAMLVAVLSMSLTLEMNIPKSRFTLFFVLCGQYSMGIYVMHILVIGAVRLVAVRFVEIHNGLLLLPLLVIAGVLIPVGIQFAAIRLGIQDLVGLPASAKSKYDVSKSI